MKKILTSLSAVLVALFTSSCVEHDALIKVNKDGSGTITETTLLSAEASAMLEQMAELGGGGQDPIAGLTDAATAAEAAKEMGEGVEVEKIEKLDKDGRKGGLIVYKFKDINEVKFVMGGSMAKAGKAMAPPGLPEEKKIEQKPIIFKYEGDVLTVTNPENKPGAAEKPAKPEVDEQALAMAQGMFKDMKMSLKIESPAGSRRATPPMWKATPWSWRRWNSRNWQKIRKS